MYLNALDSGKCRHVQMRNPWAKRKKPVFAGKYGPSSRHRVPAKLQQKLERRFHQALKTLQIARRLHAIRYPVVGGERHLHA